MKSVFIVSALILTLLPNLSLSQNFNKIIAFGDSFTDNGYINGHGFNRDTNGLVWVEYLAERLNCKEIDNRAWGGAKTDNGHYLGFDWSGFNWQVDNYKEDISSTNTLVTVWIGVNDYWDNKENPVTSVKNIKLGLEKLIEKGGSNFVVFNNFDLTLSLGYKLNSEYEKLIPKVQKLTKSFNEELYKVLFENESSLSKEYPEIQFYFIDIYEFMNNLVAKNKFNVKPWRGTYQFPDPNKFLWYDEWHPMTNCHKKIAELVLDEIKS